jgi:hypothetical protein
MLTHLRALAVIAALTYLSPLREEPRPPDTTTSAPDRTLAARDLALLDRLWGDLPEGMRRNLVQSLLRHGVDAAPDAPASRPGR